MAHVDPLHQVNHAFGDIPRVIADALQTAGGDQMIQRPLNGIRIAPHQFHYLTLYIRTHGIHAVI